MAKLIQLNMSTIFTKLSEYNPTDSQYMPHKYLIKRLMCLSNITKWSGYNRLPLLALASLSNPLFAFRCRQTVLFERLTAS